MGLRRRLFVVYGGLIAFSTVGSAASVAFGIDPGPVAPIAAALLILSGVWCLALELGSWRALALVVTIVTGAELCGLYTGLPFGTYVYTDRWWPTVGLPDGHRLPLLLPLAWVLVMGGSYLTVRRWLPKWGAIGLSAVLATAIDAPMERAMTDVFGYWTWVPPGPVFGAPVTNSVGWVAVSLVVGAVLATGRPAGGTTHAPWILSLFCGFVAVSGALRFPHPAWLVLALLAVALAGAGLADRGRADDRGERGVYPC